MGVAVHKPCVAGCYGAGGGVYAHPERSSGLVEQEPGTGAKKNAPQESGRRSNYAHLTDLNLQPRYHSFVKSQKFDDDRWSIYPETVDWEQTSANSFQMNTLKPAALAANQLVAQTLTSQLDPRGLGRRETL